MKLPAVFLQTILLALSVLFLLASCDSHYRTGGMVTDSETGMVVSGALVNYKNIDSVYTDANGRFRLEKKAYGMMILSGDVELVIEKEGYVPRYLRMAPETAQATDVIVKLTPSANGKGSTRFSQQWVKRMFGFNLYVISLLNLFTLAFLLFRPIRWKWFWILSVFTLNSVLSTCYVDGVTTFELFHLPFFFANYASHPFTIRWVIPLTTLLFWILFFRKPEWVRKTSVKKVTSANQSAQNSTETAPQAQQKPTGDGISKG